MSSASLCYQKNFLCGNIMEEYIYEKPIVLNSQGKMLRGVSDGIAKPRSKSSLGRAKKQIRRLVNSNKGLNKFLTLTFAENVTDLKTANYDFKKFKQRLERRIGKKLRYLCVPEFQKRGAVHYHLMLDMPFIQWKELSAIWGHGRIQIEEIRDKNKTGAYISKYISSEEKQDLRYFGKKLFFYSKNNLVKCVQLVDKFVIDGIKFIHQNTLRLMKAYTCFSDFRGTIKINFYHLC